MYPQEPQPPGLFGSTLMGAGFGAPGYAMADQMSLGTQQGQIGMGGPINAAFNWGVPAAITAAGVGAWTVAPMMMSAGQSIGMQRAGAAWRMLDPFHWASPGWNAGVGFARGRGLLAGARGAGFFGNLAANVAPRAAGGFGLAGGVGRFAAAGAMGVGAALPGLAAGIAAYEVAKKPFEEVYEGASSAMMGMGFMSSVGQRALPGQQVVTPGHGADMGKMMEDMAHEMGVSVKDVAGMGQQMDQMKLFQTTRSFKEFKTRFKEMLDTVKEISTTLQTSMDDALGVMGDLRQQGFYDKGDVTQAALQMRGMSGATGVDLGTYSAMGRAGAGYARSMGLRGRYGSAHFQQQLAGISYGMREGTISEEEVMEMGGPEAAAARLASKQMGFLGSARGTASIAYLMGKGGAPDPTRMQNFLRHGGTMEDIVTGAAGRGLGTLMQAQSRESKEQMLQYAPMVQIAIAQAQSQQLGWGTGAGATMRMLGTMGYDREESRMLMQQAAGMPEMLRRQEEEERYGLQQAEYARLRKEHSFVGGAQRGWHAVWDPLRRGGANAWTDLATGYGNLMEEVTGVRTYTGGGEREVGQARRAARRGVDRSSGPLRDSFGQGLLLPSASRRMINDYMGFTQDVGDLEEAIGGPLEGDWIVSGGRALSRASVARADSSEKFELDKKQRAQLQLAVHRQDPSAVLDAQRRKSMGWGQRTLLGAANMAESIARADPTGLYGRALDTVGDRGKVVLGDEERAFQLASIAGALPEGTSFQEFSGWSPERRRSLTEGIAGELETIAKETGNQRVTDLVSRTGGGDFAASSLESQRESTRRSVALTADSIDEAPRAGGGGPVSVMTYAIAKAAGWTSSRSEKLADAVNENGKARAAYTDFLAEIGKDEPDPEVLASLQNEFYDAVGGADSAAGRAFGDLTLKLQTDDQARKDFNQQVKDDGLVHRLEIRAHSEVVERHRTRAAKGISRYLQSDDAAKLGEAERAKMQELSLAARSGDHGRYSKAMGGIMRGYLQDGTISTEEISRLARATGNSSGAWGLGNKLQQGLAAKGDDELGAFIKDLEFESDEGREAVLGTLRGTKAGSKQRADAVLGALGNLTDDTMWSGSSDGKDLAGISVEYVQANTDFVLAVQAFAAKVSGDEQWMEILKEVGLALGDPP